MTLDANGVLNVTGPGADMRVNGTSTQGGGPGGGIPSVNGITTAVTIVAGTGITVNNNTPAAGNIEIVATGGAGTTLNGLSGAVTLIAGTNVNFTGSSGNDIHINATGGAGGGHEYIWTNNTFADGHGLIGLAVLGLGTAANLPLSPYLYYDPTLLRLEIGHSGSAGLTGTPGNWTFARTPMMTVTNAGLLTALGGVVLGGPGSTTARLDGGAAPGPTPPQSFGNRIVNVRSVYISDHDPVLQPTTLGTRFFAYSSFANDVLIVARHAGQARIYIESQDPNESASLLFRANANTGYWVRSHGSSHPTPNSVEIFADGPAGQRGWRFFSNAAGGVSIGRVYESIANVTADLIANPHGLEVYGNLHVRGNITHTGTITHTP
jgi:hypothetical protein